MATEVFSNSDYWIVPAGVSNVDVSCYGESGSTGSGYENEAGRYLDLTNGGNGAKVTGSVSVEPGEQLRAYIASGGSGRTRTETYSDWDWKVSSGRGGKAGLLFKDTYDDFGPNGNLLLAAAGGGGGAATTAEGADSTAANSGVGANYDTNSGSVTGQNSDTSPFQTVTVSGANYGASTSPSGNSGSSSQSREGGQSYGNSSGAVGGGGGAGMFGGGGGNADSWASDITNYTAHSVGAATGGAGGETYGNVVGTSDKAEVELTFTSSISWSNPAVSVEKYGNSNIVSWNSPGHPYGTYEIFRNGSKIDTISSSEYIDQDLSPGVYDYEVIATNPYTSTSGGSASVEQLGTFGTVNVNGTSKEVVEAYVKVNGNLKELQEGYALKNGTLKELY